MSENVNLDSMLDAAFPPAAAKVEVQVDARRRESKLTSVTGDLDGTDSSAIYPDGYQPLIVDGIALPRCASERVGNMSADERAEWEKQRFRARTDLIWTANNLMGMDLQENPHGAFLGIFPKIQPDIPFTSLSETVKKFLCLWPRGLGKSSSVRVYMFACLITYPMLRIGFMSGSKMLGKLQLAALKEYFEHPSTLFKSLFPEYCLHSVLNKKTNTWEDKPMELGTTEYFTLPCNTSKASVEPSFSILSSEMRFSGLHVDLLLIDDLVNNDNYRSSVALEKCYDEYVQVSPLLSPRGVVILTGTRYAGADTYGKIMENAVELEKGNIHIWKFSIRNCYSQGPCQNCGHYEIFHDADRNPAEAPCTHSTCHCQKFVGDGSRYVLFPEVTTRRGDPFGHTLEFLDRERATFGDKFFNLQYMNAPLNTTDNIFTQDLIGKSTVFNLSDFPARNSLETFICGDLAYSEGSRSDRDNSVLYVFQVTAGRVWVWKCLFGRWSEHERLTNILKLIGAVRPRSVFFEKTLGWASLDMNLKTHGPSFGVFNIPLFWTDVSNVKNAKALRIEQIEIAMKQDRLRLFAGMEGFEILVKELESFPNAKHDDFPDALAQSIAAPTGLMSQSLPTPETSLIQIRRWMGMDQKNVEENYPDSGMGSGFAC
jgi:hypothetical protein